MSLARTFSLFLLIFEQLLFECSEIFLGDSGVSDFYIFRVERRHAEQMLETLDGDLRAPGQMQMSQRRELGDVDKTVVGDLVAHTNI